MKKIVIAGAGIAGLTAAINLAKSGFNVKIYEKGNDVGCRFNNDFQGIENWTTEEDALQILKKMNIKINFSCIPYKKVDFYSHELEKYELKLSKPFFYSVKRGSSEKTLDQGLKEQALDKGVEIFFNKIIDPKNSDIIATGPIKAGILAKGITFKTNIEDIALAILDDNIAPKGYAYLLVNNGEATMATALFKHFESIQECFKKTMEKFRSILNFDVKNKKEFTNYGNYFLRRSWTENERLHVGERAGFQDFLWGFGMRYAMVSGFLAAKSFIENKNYDILIKENILGELKTSLSNRFFFENLGDNGYESFLDKVTNKEDPAGFLRKNYNPSFPKKIIFPIAKLKLRNRI